MHHSSSLLGSGLPPPAAARALRSIAGATLSHSSVLSVMLYHHLVFFSSLSLSAHWTASRKAAGCSSICTCFPHTARFILHIRSVQSLATAV